MNLDQAIAALDNIARQKKTSESSVERILNELLAESVTSGAEARGHEGKSKN